MRAPATVHLLVATLLHLPSAAGAQDSGQSATPPSPGEGEAGIRLLIRADDIGITHASNTAMERGFSLGVVTSASVMPVGGWFPETAALARQNPDWSLGLHLAVTSEWDRLRWGPVASRDDVPGLLASDGYLYHSFPDAPLALEYIERPPYLFPDDPAMPPAILRRRRALTASHVPPPEEVEIELRAQIDRAREAGLRIDYLDCHMGVVCQPRLASTLTMLADELCLPIPEPGWMPLETLRPFSDPRRLVETFDSLDSGLYRIVLHPNADTPETRGRDTHFGPRSGGLQALRALASEEVQEAIRRNGIELVSVRDLWDYEGCRMR